MKRKGNRRALSLLVAVLTMLSVFATAMPAFAASPVTIAAWNFTSSTTMASSIAATTGSGNLTNQMGTKPTYSSNGTIYMPGWASGSGTKYWQLAPINTTGYNRLAFTASAYSTSSGPRDFKVVYSIDSGTTWKDVSGSSVSLGSSLPGTPTWNNLPLPAETENQSALMIRLIMYSNTSVGGTSSISSTSGNSRLAAISIVSLPPPQVSNITAAPVSSTTANGSTVTLTTSTSAATIYYTLDGSTPNTGSNVYSGPIALSFDSNSTPITLNAYAVKTGMLDSPVASWIYTNKLPVVTATLSDSVAKVGTQVTLSSVVGAVYYTTDGSTPTTSSTQYSGPITIPSLPYTIKAIAAQSGYKTSDVSTFSYTAQQSYNLDGETGMAANWPLSDLSSSVSNVVYATYGDYNTVSDFSCWFDFTKQNVSFSNGGVSTSGWDNGTSKYWLLETSTKGMANVSFNWRMYSSSSGPRDFKVQYSTDGLSWADVANSAITVPNGGVISAITNLFSVNLPDSLSNLDKLYLRILKTSATSASGSAITSDGINLLNNVFLKGSYILGSIQVSPVNYVNPGSEITTGTKITFTSATSGATIMYNTDGSSSYTAATNGQITLSTLPVTLYVKASKSGMTDSRVKSFSFADPNMYHTYFGGLHAHTNISDGLGEVGDAYAYARNAGLDFEAITDHSNMFDNDTNYNLSGLLSGKNPSTDASTEWAKGHAAADSITENGKFVGIYGFEMTWSASTGFFGHINTFNTPGFETRNNSYFTTNSPTASLNGLKRYYDDLTTVPGALAQLNHPGTIFGDFNDFAFYNPMYDANVKLVEVGNGEGAIGSSGYFPSYDYYTRALDRGWHVAPSNNQDNHLGKWGDSNTARTVVLAQNLTRNDIYNAINARRVYATEDNNLQINYTVNGNEMGYIYTDGSAPTNDMDFHVHLVDPDNVISGGTVSVIVNGGKVAQSITIGTDSNNGALLAKTSKGTEFNWDFQLPPDYSYYYIQVVEPIGPGDGFKAVTAPVWIGPVQNIGVKNTTINTTMPVKNLDSIVSTTIYDDEALPLTINSIEYSVNGQIVKHEDNPLLCMGTSTTATSNVILANTTGSYNLHYIPDRLGKYNIDVTINATFNGVSRVFKDVLKIDVADPATVTTIAVDAAHFNDYIAGNYANDINAFTKMAANCGISVKLITTAITDDTLKDSKGNYVSALIVSPPARKSGTYSPKDGSTPTNYTPMGYSTDELAAITRYEKQGGNFIICGNSGYSDAADPYKASTQINSVLQAVYSTTYMRADEGYEGTGYRLYFPYDNHNHASPYTVGVKQSQSYSFYSGASIGLDQNAVNDGRVQYIVKGNSTTYASSDYDKQSTYTVKPGDLVALVSEKLPDGGTAIIGGTTYISDFEIPDFDPTNSVQYSNMQIMWNFLKTIQIPIPKVSISTVRSAENGKTYTIEGTVTSCTVHHNAGNAFFDTMYVQDATGGLDVFGISQMDIQVGQKVRLTGRVGDYLGDKELVLSTENDVQIIDSNVKPLTPTEFTTSAAMNQANGGWLGKVYGEVTKVDTDDQGFVQAIYVKDSGDSSQYGARLFIDGYIGYSSSNSPRLESFVKPGAYIQGVGLISTDTDGQRLRVRDRSEIRLLSQTQNTTGDTSKDTSGKTDNTNPTGNQSSNPTDTNTTPPANTPGQGENTNKVTSTVPAAVDASGKATAAVTADQIKDLVAAVKDSAASATVQIKVDSDTGAKQVEVKIPQDAFKQISAVQSKSVEIASGIGTVAFDKSAVNAINTAASGDVSVSIAKADTATLSDSVKAAVGDHPVYNFAVQAGGSTVSQFGGGNVTVKIPYTPAPNEDKNAIVIYYIDQNGKLSLVNASGFDAATGSVTFVTTHFSTYAVGYNKVSFTDTENNWSKDNIAYLAARNIVGGAGNGTFAPDQSITRAEFAKILAGILNVDVSSYTGSQFSDVAADAWYAPYVAWAAKNGIASGSGDGKFNPNASISREEMAVMITRFANTAKYKLASSVTSAAFADNSKISSWAVDSVSAVQAAGIISGKPGNIFDPKAGATRAEAAKMLTVLLKGVTQ